MRIGIVCFAAIGGSSTVAASLARHLVDAGHAVFLLAPARPERLAPHSGVCLRTMPHAGSPLQPGTAVEIHRLARAIARVTFEDRLDVVHAHYAHPHAVAAVYAREMLEETRRPTVVVTLHGTDVTGNPRLISALSASLAASDAVSAVSAFLADAASEAFGIPRPVVIPNGVEPPPADASLHGGRPMRPRGEPVLLHVSTLRPVKRAVDCVGILARVVRRMPCRLLVVGDGPDAGVMRSESARLHVADKVTFVGSTPNVEPYLAQADLLLLPSASESFGLVALEAMAAGVPVVGSRVGGLSGVVVEGVCGRLLPVGDLDGMAAAACELLSQPWLAAAYAEAGRRLARERHTPADVAAAYGEFYDRARARRAFQVPMGAS